MTDLVTFVSVNLRGAQLAEKRCIKFPETKTLFNLLSTRYTFYKARRKLYKKPMGL